MSLAILHLSDLHFKVGNNWLQDKAPAILAAIRNDLVGVSNIFLVCTGDVAFSGMPAEYTNAHNFFRPLLDGLQSLPGQPGVASVFIPGNHDCDLTLDTDARQLAVEHMAARINSITESSEIVTNCLLVQRDYFEFAAAYSGGDGSSQQRLFRVHAFDTLGCRVLFHCYNTAWLSQKNERQGQLFFPTNPGILPKSPSGSSLVVSLLHHPYGWFQADNARQLRHEVEHRSDYILTGHEHDLDTYKKEISSSKHLRYIEAPLLQGGAHSSGFNLILLSVETTTASLHTYSWHGDIYAPTALELRESLIAHDLHTVHGFRNTTAYSLFLSDPGAGFTHPLVKSLTLDDIFIYPELRRRSIDQRLKGGLAGQNDVRGDELLQYIWKNKRLLIVGAERSGKTALARIIYRTLQNEQQVIPLLISGVELGGTRENQYEAILRRAFAQQYEGLDYEHYRQTPSEQKVILIDDFHNTRLSYKYQTRLLQHLCETFGHVIAFGDDTLGLGPLDGSANAPYPFGNFEQCQIKPFGHVLRGRLIEKWVRLGREHDTSDEEITHEVVTSENLVSTLLGKNLLPSYPVIILSVLQTWQMNKTHNMGSGSYGYLYEALIITSLSGHIAKPTDLDTAFTYLSRVAYYLYDRNVDSLSEEELDLVNDMYFQEYSIRVDRQAMITRLCGARILERVDHRYRIRYKYQYYYFVARYFREALANDPKSETLRLTLQQIAAGVYYETNANILIFYIYLTRDRELLNVVLANARQIFDEVRPCDFDADVEFINKLYKETAKPLMITTSEKGSSLEEYRQSLDESELGEEQRIAKREAQEEARIEYARDLAVLLRFSIAIRTLEILGQIVRNFPGSLRGDVKLEIMRESYSLGLRTLRMVLGLLETNLEEARLYLSELIKERRAIHSYEPLTEQELLQTTDQAIMWIGHCHAFGMLKKISGAVGLGELKETYQSLLNEKGPDVAVRLIDVAIRLDHFPGVPENEIIALDGDLRGNACARNTLRELVASYLYLFPVDFKTRQSLMGRFDIGVKAQRLIESANKRLPRKPKNPR